MTPASRRPPRGTLPLACALLLGGAGLTAACERGQTYKSGGSVTPTVSGAGGGAAYANAEAAKAAFSRSNGPLTAVLEDVSWIRLESDAATAEERHPDYFKGLTVIDVELYTMNFARPTEETYLLEDSLGASVSTKPASFKSSIQGGVGPKFFSSFLLVFSHTLSKDARWLRLTRKADEGGAVTWQLP